MEKIHIKRVCVKREIIEQNHFVEKKMSLCENVIISWVLGFVEWCTILGGLQSCNHFCDSEILVRRFCGCRKEMSNHVKFLCSLLFFYGIIFLLCSEDYLWMWVILFKEALIIQQWYQSYDWKHTKVWDTVVW